MVNCAASFCKHRSETTNLRNHGVSYHMFPKWPKSIREKWRIFCGHTENWRPTRTSVICSDHFTLSSFEVVPNNRRKLVEGAVPTINKLICKEEPHAELLISENASATKVYSSQKLTKVEIPDVILQLHSQCSPQSKQSHSYFNSQLSNPPSESIPQLSTRKTIVSELIETPRIAKLRKQLQFKNKKIRLLQARNRYLKKRVVLYKNTLQELANNLDLFY